jgi:hypothetical protein
MLRINHILLLLILLASHMDSQHIALWSCSFLYLHLRGLMNPPFHPPSVCPSANLSSFHLPHTETRQWGPHPSSVFPEISALPGALISHWGAHFCNLYIFPQFIPYLLYKHLYSQSLRLSSPLATHFPFGHMQPMSPLVGALLLIFPRRHRLCFQSTTQVTYLYPLNLFTLSNLWHSLSLILSSP